MPEAPAHRAQPRRGSKYLSQIVGERAGEARRLRNISQEEIADRMVEHGHATWQRQTVGLVENAQRNLTVDELVSLAAVLETTMAFLVSPASAGDPNYFGAVDIGASEPLARKDLRRLYGFTWLPYPQANPNELWPSPMFEEDDDEQH